MFYIDSKRPEILKLIIEKEDIYDICCLNNKLVTGFQIMLNNEIKIFKYAYTHDNPYQNKLSSHKRYRYDSQYKDKIDNTFESNTNICLFFYVLIYSSFDVLKDG